MEIPGETMDKHIFVGLVLTVALGLSLVGCQDTKAREENEQLKAHVLQLQKDAGELGNRIDVLTRENAELKDEIERLKKRHPAKKTPKTKAHRSTSKEATGSQN
jgi:cell division protein FtsB